MDKKTYLFFRLLVVALVAGIVSVSVVQGNYIVPMVVAITAALVIYAAKKRVKGVLADERDYQIAGSAARWSLNVYAAFAAVTSMILMAQRSANPIFEPVAQVFAYSACALLITQSLLFKYFQNKNNG